MAFSNILSVLENVDYEKSEEEQKEKVLQKLKQQISKEQAKRLSLEFAIKKCKSSVRDISFAYAFNQAQNKIFTNFQRVLRDNLKMQEELVNKMKSHDWNLANELWRFKIKTLEEHKEKTLQKFRKQRELWERKLQSIPEYKDIQKTLKLLEEKEGNLLELQEQWKIRKEMIDIKYRRMNKNFQEISITLDSSEKIAANLKQETENLEAEIKRLDASKLEETRLIKDLEKNSTKREHVQTKEIAKKENTKHYRETRRNSLNDVFHSSPFPDLKTEKMNVKTLIEDRKCYNTPTPNTSGKLVNFPKSQIEKIDSIKLEPDKQIKILEHIVVKSAAPDTAKAATVSEQVMSTEILDISQNKNPSVAQHLEQSNKETDGELLEQNVVYRTQTVEKADTFHTTESNSKDDNKTNQPKKIKILKQEELNDEEKEKEAKPKIVIEDDKSKREENAEKKSDNEPISKIKEEEKQKIIKVGNVETDENNKFKLQEFPENKTTSNVNKRKSDAPSSEEENLNAKQFKFKTDNSASTSKSDFKSVQPDKVSVRDHSDSENDMDNILRKAFELCEIPEITGNHSNEDFESFFNNLRTIDSQLRDAEKPSILSSDDFLGWGDFGNNFKTDDDNNEDKGFFN